ncbi:hypothetical protein Aspvir_003226 [Aspergillus viridinutans]|uniref:Methyltransferase type 11 domain-containing protein n=1 Tax=Aspergillus viridinutans TaxID=75553 RepID=A0A9P3C4A8_ASPVI|nr:uncharacterized protein Aspvir_003226 [Aspergillus viridinutans]GIK07560.1 hypothetical protein Aspvir_003226 [Aspergillus viridinutans]
MPPKPGRLASIFRACVHWEALTQAVRRDGLAALGRPRQIRDAASAKLLTGNFIAYEDTTIVLELGPGPGNQTHRYDTSLVKHVYGVEPNPHFKDDIDAKLDKRGLRDRYTLIACGVEDSDVLREVGITEGSLDAVLCIQVLCAVKDPNNVMKEVWKLLKPGGKFIFWEHGWSRNRLTTVAQDIVNSGEWENTHEIEEPEDPFSLLPRIQGVLVKKKA